MKKGAVVYVSVFKPAEDSRSTDQLLGERVYILPSDAGQNESVWPTLSLLLEPSGQKLVQDFRTFGFALPDEKELLLVPPEKFKTMQDSPNPFYTQDKDISLHRYRNTYTWVCANPQNDRALWIEKDSFIPLELHAPCPDATGGSECIVEFQNAWNMHETKNTRLIVKRDAKSLYLLKIDHVIFSPSSSQIKLAKESAAKANADKSLEGVDALMH